MKIAIASDDRSEAVAFGFATLKTGPTVKSNRSTSSSFHSKTFGMLLRCVALFLTTDSSLEKRIEKIHPQDEISTEVSNRMDELFGMD